LAHVSPNTVFVAFEHLSDDGVDAGRAAESIGAEAAFDRRGTQLIEEIEVPFPRIRLVINVITDGNDADMEKVKADLHRFCPVAKVIRNAGTQIEEVWNVTRP